MADAIANNRFGDLWKESWAIKGHNNVTSGSVDGHVDEEKISQQIFGENIIYTIVFHTLMMIYTLLNRKLMTGWIWVMKFIKWVSMM